MRVMFNGRIGDKWTCHVVASRNPTQFVIGVGDDKAEALADLVEKLCDRLGYDEHVHDP